MPVNPPAPAPAMPVEEYVQVNGVRLFCRSIGTGPAVIVLHGGPGAHHDYLLPQYDSLATGRQLYYYDQRGGGRSSVDRDRPVDWKTHVADLDRLIDRWSLAPATILGYSWGGLLALLYAVEYGDRVTNLALVSPAPITRRERELFEQRFTRRMEGEPIRKRREELRTSNLRSTDPEAYRRRAFELSVAPYFRDPSMAKDLTPFRVTGRTQSAVWESLGDYDLTRQVAVLTTRTLVMHGAFDPIPVTSAQRTAELLDAEFVLLEQSGHVPHVEEPEHFRQTLDSFLPRT